MLKITSMTKFKLYNENIIFFFNTTLIEKKMLSTIKYEKKNVNKSLTCLIHNVIKGSRCTRDQKQGVNK